jgi:hypothetical protein
VTLTVGGNDLLLALSVARDLRAFRRAVAQVQKRYTRLVAAVHDRFPHAALLLTTVYAPTDGTGLLPGAGDRLPIELLDETNDHVRHVARATLGARLADVHRHFLGHGVSVPVTERWYWPQSIIEPSARGASEIRRVWLEALEGI